jgi:protease II
MDSKIRNLDFISWRDPYGDFEDTDSKPFINAVKEEDVIFSKYLNTVSSDKKDIWLKEFHSLRQANTLYYDFTWNKFKIKVNEHDKPTIMFERNYNLILKTEELHGQYICDSHIITICDFTNGKENLTLNLYDSTLKNTLSLENVGDTAVLDGADLYYCKAEGVFWFNEIIKVDIRNNSKETIYKEKDKSYVLRLEKPDKQSNIFIKRTSAIYQDLAIIDKNHNKARWFIRGFGTKKALSGDIIAFDSYFTYNNKPILYPGSWKFVDAKEDGDVIQFIFTKDVYQSLWIYTKGTHSWRRIDKEQSVCEFQFSIAGSKCIVRYPNKPDTVWSLIFDDFVLKKTMKGANYTLQKGTTPLPWFSIQSTATPKAVVICGYGSYGTPLKKRQQRLWIPWLNQNYMIVNICVRGGGENGDEWWDASRTATRRFIGVNDFVRGVNFIQSKFGFNNKNTIIYGRSAGGFLVNAASFLLLDKITVVYSAKPYTDLLRTITNPNELQTIQEKEEFGLAHNNPLFFYLISKISPYENIRRVKKNPVILLTGGLNDNQVGPYMPLKYAKRLREHVWKNVFCRMAKDEGHFTSTAGEEGEALDAALCDSFINQ